MIRRFALFVALAASFLGLSAVGAEPSKAPDRSQVPYTMVLGIAQDGGYPQAACQKSCCEPAHRDASLRRHVACLAIVDPATGQRWLIDATPDIKDQLRMLDEAAPSSRPSPAIAGVFLTHAHIGHYVGLAQLGREVIGASGVPVYAMPRMRAFLGTNGPWGQLVELGNIRLRDLHAGAPVELTSDLQVTPLLVPHRDEYSETVGFRIEGPDRSVLYIPDIDKWSRWEQRIEDEIARVDVAYLDGTFYADGELPGRDMDEIPHPFIEETMDRLAGLPDAERAKVRFIHCNHTNPVVRGDAEAIGAIEAAGFGVAVEGELVPLGGG